MLIILIVKSYQVDSPALEERLSFIRKGSGINKSQILILSGLSEPLFTSVAMKMDNIKQSILSQCAMVYSEKEKKMRKKKSKITSGPPKLEDSLSSKEIIAIYDFKIGLMAELKRDFDAAIK